MLRRRIHQKIKENKREKENRNMKTNIMMKRSIKTEERGREKNDCFTFKLFSIFHPPSPYNMRTGGKFKLLTLNLLIALSNENQSIRSTT